MWFQTLNAWVTSVLASAHEISLGLILLSGEGMACQDLSSCTFLIKQMLEYA
jgi:hypothetical protein